MRIVHDTNDVGKIQNVQNINNNITMYDVGLFCDVGIWLFMMHKSK